MIASAVRAVRTRLLEDSVRSGVWPDSDQVLGAQGTHQFHAMYTAFGVSIHTWPRSGGMARVQSRRNDAGRWAASRRALGHCHRTRSTL
jgi:hypothetical protein